jgi:outer membrane protein assembly factor BamE (lipoprotein component of BamABCDE complex)
MQFLPHISVIRATITISAACLIALTPSCGLVAEAEVSHTRSQLADLEIGQTKDEVVRRMGPAWKTEAFHRGGEDYLLLYYRTQRIPGVEITNEELTPLLFRGEALIGWGFGVLELME